MLIVVVQEWLLGRKTMEVEILKEALDLAQAKNPVKTVSTTLGVARSNILERRDVKRPLRAPQERPGTLSWQARSGLLIEVRPIYGYRADRRAIKARAAIRRFGPGQRQARLSTDEEAWPLARTAYRTPAAARA